MACTSLLKNTIFLVAFLVGHSTLKHDEFSNGTIMSILSEAESTADAMKNASKYLERIAIKLAQTFE